MQKIPWYQKIQIQIPVIVFLIILIPAAAFGSYDVGASRQSQRQNAETSMSERLYETSLLMQDVMQDLEDTEKRLAENTEFLELLKEYQTAPYSVKARSGLLLALGQSAWPCVNMERMYLLADGSPWILTSDPEEKLLDRDSAGQELYRQFVDEISMILDGIDYLCDYLDGKPLEDTYYEPTDIVNTDNAAYYLQNDLTW